jgi:thiamine biosynthesis lipoprotein
MTSRGKLWLSSFIFGFAVGVVVFYTAFRQEAPSGSTRPEQQKPAYQLEPLKEAALTGGKLCEFTQLAHQMGTEVTIKAHATDRAGVEKAFRAAFDRIHEIECMMSVYRPDSPLAKINAAAKAGGYAVAQELGIVIAKSLEFCRLTGGALDITVRPLLDAYKFASAHKRPPQDEEIQAALAHVGYQKVSVSSDYRTVTIADDGMALDLGATAKGYAADEAAKVLRSNGIVHGCVEAGGDIRIVGRRGDGKPWHVGVQDPGGKRGETVAVLMLSEGAVCTSGNYARGYRLGEQKVSHIIDPRTGKPCDQNPSVTVVAGEAFWADALATALSVLGSEGLRIIEHDKMKGVEAMLLSVRDGKLEEHRSSGFGKLLESP